MIDYEAAARAYHKAHGGTTVSFENSTIDHKNSDRRRAKFVVAAALNEDK